MRFRTGRDTERAGPVVEPGGKAGAALPQPTSGTCRPRMKSAAFSAIIIVVA